MFKSDQNLTIIAWPKKKNKKNNPYQNLLYATIESNTNIQVEEFSMAKIFFLWKVDILHIHWPDVFLSVGKGYKFWPRYLFLKAVFSLAKLSKTKIVWTAHNFQRRGQQNYEKLDTYFWPWFLKRVDGIIYMTKASKNIFIENKNLLSNKPSTVIPHGHYKSVIVLERKNHFRKEKPVILFFGSINIYKNVYKLLEAFISLPKGSAELRVKGKMSSNEPDKKFLKLLEKIQKRKLTNDIVYDDSFLSDNVLANEVFDCDLVVLPYTDVHNSGAAIYALSLARPILASNTPLFRELQEMVGKEWVTLFDKEISSNDLEKTLDDAIKLKRSGIKPDLTQLDWPVIAQKTICFYKDLILRR